MNDHKCKLLKIIILTSDFMIWYLLSNIYLIIEDAHYIASIKNLDGVLNKTIYMVLSSSEFWIGLINVAFFLFLSTFLTKRFSDYVRNHSFKKKRIISNIIVFLFLLIIDICELIL